MSVVPIQCFGRRYNLCATDRNSSVAVRVSGRLGLKVIPCPLLRTIKQLTGSLRPLLLCYVLSVHTKPVADLTCKFFTARPAGRERGGGVTLCYGGGEQREVGLFCYGGGGRDTERDVTNLSSILLSSHLLVILLRRQSYLGEI